MWKEIDIFEKEGITLFLRVINGYSCIATHTPLYTDERIKKVFINYKNSKIFYWTDGKIESVVAVVDDIKEKEKILSWANNFLGIKTEVDLIKVTNEYFTFIRDYLISRNKNIWYSRIQWKDYKPVHRSLFKTWDKITDEIGHQYLDFKFEPEEQILFRLK